MEQIRNAIDAGVGIKRHSHYSNNRISLDMSHKSARNVAKSIGVGVEGRRDEEGEEEVANQIGGNS